LTIRIGRVILVKISKQVSRACSRLRRFSYPGLPGGSLKIRFLGTHNTESKESKLVTFLIDNVLAVEAGGLTSGLTCAEQEKIRAILLSHGHYDHIKDLPAFAFGNSSRKTDVFGTRETLQIFSSHLADGLIYPEFSNDNSFIGETVLNLCPVEPHQAFSINSYQVLPIAMHHTIDAVGFEIANGSKRIFYTGDTGSGFAGIWKYVSPQLIIADLTLPNRLRDVALKAGHLCPEMLKDELVEFRQIKEYLPRVIAVHMTPRYEPEIKENIKVISEELQLSISLAAEGDEIIV